MSEDQSPYKILTIDLTGPTPASSSAQILDKGIPIGDVAILQLPAAAVGQVFLRIGGPNADKIPLRLEGQNFHIYRTKVQGGIYLDNAVGFAGVSLVIFVGIQDTAYEELLANRQLDALLRGLAAQLAGGVKP